MPQMLSAHLLPALVTAEALAGGSVVMIDVLRASTTITVALAAGARSVIPCLEVDEARRIAAELPAGTALLGGERGGLPIAGFDLGNSPAEYVSEQVAGRTIVFTTTNGTRALDLASRAAEVLVGAAVNASAVAATLEHSPPGRAIHLLCAGTRGQVTREDVLVAGLLVERLLWARGRGGRAAPELNDQARLARDAWRGALAGHDAASWRAALCDTQGGRNLAAIGLEADIERAARLDSLAVVGRLRREAARRWIEAAPPAGAAP